MLIHMRPVSLSRTSSTTSLESDTRSDEAEGNDSLRRTRKRFNNGQLMLLEDLFHQTSHPTRAQRELVASTGGMEMKSVTIWFQNKRQTERRGALSSVTNALQLHDLSVAHRSSAKSYETRPSLDRIASRTERPTPSTPQRQKDRTPNASLWDSMLSSPIAAPNSPPQKEYVEFGKLKRTRTLEWACAKMRLVEKENPSGHGKERTRRVSGKPVPYPTPMVRAATWSAGDSQNAPPASWSPRSAPDDDMLGAALALCGLGRGV